MMIEVGTRAPDFVIPGTEGESIQKYRLSNHTESGGVVLVFYPFDFSPVCIEQLCNMSEVEWLTLSDDIDVFGVSMDSCFSHKRFMAEYDLNFPLLSDTRGGVIDDYGLSYEELEHHRGVPKRALLAVDADKTVRYRWTTEDAYESPAIDNLLEAVDALHDHVVP